MTADDVLLPSFREQGAQFCHGVTMVEILRYWGGDERGSDFAAARHDFPICVPIGTQAPHAAGIAYHLKRTGSDGVVYVSGGEGSTSEGDWRFRTRPGRRCRLPTSSPAGSARFCRAGAAG